MHRLTLRAELGPEHDACALADLGSRTVRAADRDALAGLLLAAFRGTVDDAGEGPAEALLEVDRLFGGAYGGFEWPVSEVVEREGAIAAGTLVTLYDSRPLVAFSLTVPAWQRRGLARAGLLRVMSRLRRAGWREVMLAVTAANVPARRLYASVGFLEVRGCGTAAARGEADRRV